MHLNPGLRLPRKWKDKPAKALLILRFVVLLTFAGSLNASAKGYTQKITLSEKNASLKKIFREVKKQTGLLFFYTDEQLSATKTVTIDVKDASIETVLEACLKDQRLTYTIVNQTVVIKDKQETQRPVIFQAPIPPPEVRGVVSDESGKPLAGVSVLVKGTKKGTSTTADGAFMLRDVEPNATLVFSSVGFETTELVVGGRTDVSLRLKTAVMGLDETVVIAYGTTSKRLNTGSVSSVNSETIANQPVADPLSALQGRASGLMITSSNGLPGSSFQVRIRGENSMKQGNDPLYIIDGVPFFSTPINMFSGANGTQSPLNSLNPNDIERIDILKDADATAIYGSRGANGVIIITTKKGKSGESQVNVNVYTGVSRVSNKLDLLNTAQYLQIRKDAFQNDGVAPTATTAPDLLVWDQNAYTDWQDLLIGNTANVTEAQVSFSGGTSQTRFVFSGTYRRETTVLLGDFSYKKGGVHLNVDHSSKDGRFGVSGSMNYTTDDNNSVPTDVSQYIYLPPNYPLNNPDGSLYWFGSVQNPVAYLNRTYETNNNNLIGNSVIRYNLLKGLSIRANLGFTQTNMKQVQTLPASGFNPVTFTGSSSQYANSSVKSYIVEPQAEYNTKAGPGRLNILAGLSWQQNVSDGQYVQGTGYSSDALLKDMLSAATLSVRGFDYRQYNYQSAFGRVNYNLNQTYIVNLTFRRDGSSRFGPGKQFGNFGAVGGAWLFSNEKFAVANLGFLSYGKLRASYGTTGNDQIGDYQYLDTWGSTSFPYGGLSGLSPTRVYNPDYSWEINKKLEGALELGFLKDRILFTAGYYRNRSSNQLIGYTLSPQSGFSSYTANLPATVENSGWEFDLNTTNIKNKNFSWNTSLNLTLPSNKLLEYPGLAGSADAASYEVGQSTRMIKGFKFTVVNPTTGVPEFLDVNKDGVVSSPGDYVVLGKTMPQLFGGLSNQLTYKNLRLDIFFQFVKQESITVDWGPLVGVPGSMNNKDLSVLRRWAKPGDVTDIPRASATTANVANTAYRNFYRTSDAAWGDASYIRLKNVALVYDLSALTGKWKMRGSSIYIQGQNLITITNYKGLDPEINGFDRRFVFPINPFGSVRAQAIPVLKTVTIGLKLTL
ncbi:SusC/RagA family TonB-linked outer membrane protein [Segetibacter sp. 3557_3]|uniref:SusC/RagA family TonB-linked outer membrane protein n=1 Tax=Segetibacter sp. 3557_3 TaxID=2547429 RepID=UPI001058826A|nr:SusC/RagA family TonB-linked outer membrane protein [Segetibacter sp. 3557_3]TDH21413.1 SusC/RagA family TonB-linked outer membrane protein [Segetibacter sp. 3557_3]